MQPGMFTSPQVILFSSDIEASSAFYRRLGFRETFRVPVDGAPIHADLELGGYKIGFASIQSAEQDHGLHPLLGGQRATITVWTDGTAAAYRSLVDDGVVGLREPYVWLDRLLVAWIQDPDEHPIQIAQRLV